MFKLVLIFLQLFNIQVYCSIQRGWLLNDGNIMPPIAFGTFGKRVDIEDKVGQSIEWAIEAGYRHIDTSYIYLNERVIGDAIKKVIKRGVITRKDLFITTKLDVFSNRSLVIPALRNSLKRLQTDYVDLYLIHSARNLTGSPINYLESWKGMEDAKKLGLTRSIGVSNFNSSQINDIFVSSKTRPAVNQIEVNPTYTNLDLVAYCQSQGIRVMSYSPLGMIVPRPLLENLIPNPEGPVIAKIAQKYGKTATQVVIRYLIDRDTIPIPRSTNREHIKSNIDVFDFSLTEKEIYMINQFNINIKIFNDLALSDELFEEYYGGNKKEFLEMYLHDVSLLKP
ncbi:aldo-keto reductase AKR2E4-like [Danaus plexippus]|uniref:aldo-keto reductase AKR2E4-like n=1 Tax=Danaus plexippus TaxID=13037 RepID=UPI002AB2D977|nr:aldo-keto reductase AKR2E4-like [Danaus plexippus]